MAYKKKSAPKNNKIKRRDGYENLTKEDLIKWKAFIVAAQYYQKKHGNMISGTNSKEGRWDINVKALDGDFNSREDLGDEAVDVNVTHSTIQTLLSPLWTTEPYITVTPTMARFVDGDQEFDNILHAQITEHEINYWLRELNVRSVVKKCILDSAATNQGFAYLGYIKEKGDVENTEGEMVEFEPQIRFKQPFVKRVPVKNVLMPAGYYDLEECPWVAIGFVRCVADIKERYDVEDLKADVVKMDDKIFDGMEGLSVDGREYLKSDDAGYATVWQIWDKRSKKLISLTMNHDEELECEPWPVDTEGFPLDKLRLNLVPDQQFGMPIMSAWISQQKELNAARTATRRRESRTKAVAWMNDLPEGVEDAYKKAEDGTIINLKSSDVDDIRKAVLIDTGLPPHMSAYNYGATQLQDILMISGLGLQQRGSGDPNIGSATASALVDKWAQTRQTDYGDSVRQFWLNIARKLWMILKQFPNVKRDMLIVGKTGMLQRITYTLAELRGEFSFTMDLGAMFSRDPVSRRQNAFARYNLLRQDPLVRADKLVSDLLKADQINDVDSYMMKLLSPQEEFMKMLQGLPAEAHELDDHISHMQQHQQQGAQLERVIDTTQPGSPQETQARTSMLLLLSHINDTMRLMQMLDSKSGGGAGSPVAENMMRQQLAPPGETEAEMGGQPVGISGGEQTPAGIGVA
jgi:hypothetical protein